ncbi:hypothetical protein [Aggregatibacter aphrophilus]|jgi:hypothetical protein|uniref:Uncharacterized protein n=1 Tax=Aggregatibacter aphrophilus TaxID=732 RepID=A0AAP7L4A0_AGGAP|nr:hypothetical protein [Aggregatibacter aphrophilus]OBY54189.1 hypothetical protein BBB52_01700 [Aggregatibacter aphrophilus]
MRNIIQIALLEHLHQHADNQERMAEYYNQFKQAEQDSTQALKMYSDLVFSYGIELDALQENIDGSILVGIGSTLKHLCAELALAQSGREQTDTNLNILEQGESHES